MAHNSTNEYLKLLNELRAYQIPTSIVDSLSGYLKSIYRSELENHFSAPMLWIGLYIALASLVCILAMVADLLHGFRSKKLWFPCKYFRINSVFLTVISVAMKLPVDLTGSMPGTVDQVAKLGSMAFMCTMMANLLPCLATMDSNDLLSNIAALCVVVITLVVNVCIQIQTGVVSILTYNNDPRITALVSPTHYVKSLPVRIENYTILHFIYVTLLVVFLVVHVCSSLAILKSRKILESKYQQGHESASKDIQSSSKALVSVEKLQMHVYNHWIMEGSGSPQFVFTTCFDTASASGVICVFVAILHIITISWTFEAMLAKDYDSDYSWSMILIVIVQFIGVVIATIAPLARCFAIYISFGVMSFKIMPHHFKVFKVESYWTQTLYEWTHSSIRLQFLGYKLEVFVNGLKRLILKFCIGFQKGVVVVCKIIALIPFFVMICVLYCLSSLKYWLLRADSWVERTVHSECDEKFIRRYVLRLNDEMLPARRLRKLSKSWWKLIKKGEKNPPRNLVDLIREKSTRGFHGVERFDRINHHLLKILLYCHNYDIHNYDVPFSISEYQDCWRLPVVTLTTIAVSLYRIEKNEVERLLKSVREGLVYVTLVEESLNVTCDNVILQKMAETLWGEVDVYKKWLGNTIRDPSSQARTAGQIVEWFNDTAECILYPQYTSTENLLVGANYYSIICAYSMYRITKKILLTYNANMEDKVSQKELFDNLSSMIADIIAACLTNLPQVITMKCHTSEIEKREASVKDATQLLGMSTEIIEILQRHDIPNMNPNDRPFIDKWRAYSESLN